MSGTEQQAGGELEFKATGEQQWSDRQGSEAGGEQTGDEPVFPDLKVGEAWGESITQACAAELEARLQAWEQEADHGKRKGPFDGAPLTGADVFWLAARTLADTPEQQAVVVLRLCRPDGIINCPARQKPPCRPTAS